MATKLPSVTKILTVFSIILILNLPFLFVRPVFAARIFEDGFESGNWSKWSPVVGNPQVTSGDAHHGTYKAVLNTSGQYAQARFTNVDHCFFRAYVMFKSFPASGSETPILGVYNTSGVYMSEARVYFNASGAYWRLRYYNGGHITVTSGQQRPVLDTWYCVEVEGKSNTTTGAESRIYIDGNELTDVSQTGENNNYLINCAYIWESVTGGVTLWYDCVVVDTAYIGPEEMSPPTFGTIGTNTSIAGKPCSFYCLTNDNVNVSTYIFSTNNTGAWTNDTAVTFSNFFNSTAAWANVTKTLNDTVGNVVSYMWCANDTSNNWSHSDRYNLTTTAIQRYLTVVSPYGTPGGQGWYNNGSTAYATLDTGIVDQGNGTQRVFTNWSGDASGTDYSQSDPITMNENKTAIAVWKTQHNVTFSSSGLDSSASGTVATVNDVPVSYGELPYSIWVDADSDVTYSYSNVSSSTSGKRFLLSDISGPPSPITVTTPVLINGEYKVQFQINVDQTGVGSDFPETIVTVDGTNYTYSSLPAVFWWDSESSHSYSFESPLVVDGKQYNWASTTGLSTERNDTLTITGPGSATGNYGFDYEVRFDATGVAPDAAGTIVIIDGTNYNVSELPLSFWWAPGSNHTYAYQSPLEVTGDGKQYVWTSTNGLSNLQSDTLTITGPGSITGNYKTQYYLTVSSLYGTPIPATGWFDAGTNITASVNSPVPESTDIRHACTGWTGTGSAPASGTATSVTFTLDQQSTITWNWKTQYYLTVDSAYGVTGGQDWYDSDSTAYATVTPLVVAGPSGTQYVFDQWSGDASGSTSPSNPIVMSAPKTATANWKTQYYLDVSSAHDSPSPTSGWFDSGTIITASVTSPSAGPVDTQYVCTGWTGTGSAPASGGSSFVTFTINQVSSLTWNWKTQYLLTVLTYPDGLSPQPTRDPVGEAESSNSWWYDDSASVYLTAQEVDLYTFNYWTVNGASQGSGVNPTIIDMDAPHTAVAYYSLSDITPPEILILSPENKTYYTASISLGFRINETASWIGYSIDNQVNITVSGNTTFVAEEGSHSMILYANDTVGNMGSSNTVYFTARTGVSDIAVLSVQTSKTIVGQGYFLNINVTVENQGDYLESINVTLYGNAAVIEARENVILPRGTQTILTFTWNTAGFAKGNYTISAYTESVPGEIDTADNNCTGGLITVTIPGDVTGEGLCDMLDISIMIDRFMATPADVKRWDPNCDVNGDLSIDMADIGIAIDHFMQS